MAGFWERVFFPCFKRGRGLKWFFCFSGRGKFLAEGNFIVFHILIWRGPNFGVGKGPPKFEFWKKVGRCQPVNFPFNFFFWGPRWGGGNFWKIIKKPQPKIYCLSRKSPLCQKKIWGDGGAGEGMRLMWDFFFFCFQGDFWVGVPQGQFQNLGGGKTRGGALSSKFMRF